MVPVVHSGVFIFDAPGGPCFAFAVHTSKGPFSRDGLYAGHARSLGPVDPPALGKLKPLPASVPKVRPNLETRQREPAPFLLFMGGMLERATTREGPILALTKRKRDCAVEGGGSSAGPNDLVPPSRRPW